VSVRDVVTAGRVFKGRRGRKTGVASAPACVPVPVPEPCEQGVTWSVSAAGSGAMGRRVKNSDPEPSVCDNAASV
jgi:hypothetical protein